MLRLTTVFVAPALVLLLAACGGEDAPVELAPPGPATFLVTAGDTEGAFDIEQFMPATVRVRAGDSITWTAKGYEGHTVTFFPDGRVNIGVDEYLVPAEDTPGTREFNPVIAVASEAQGSYDGSAYTNSGFMGVPTPQEYTLTFPSASVYPYLCMVHPLHMRGVVVVDEVDAEVAHPSAVVAEGERLRSEYVDEAERVSIAAREQRAAAGEASEGRSWEVSVGLDTAQAQVLAFVPATLEIDAGDKVVFWNSDRDFHNVIFAPEGRDPPQFPIIVPDERGGFRLLINPEAEAEAPPPEGFGPEAFFSSGLMGIGFPRFYYEVTFTQPGTYRYFCTVHTLAGMAGTIEVR